jgi:hypothetical protein
VCVYIWAGGVVWFDELELQSTLGHLLTVPCRAGSRAKASAQAWHKTRAGARPVQGKKPCREPAHGPQAEWLSIVRTT